MLPSDKFAIIEYTDFSTFTFSKDEIFSKLFSISFIPTLLKSYL